MGNFKSYDCIKYPRLNIACIKLLLSLVSFRKENRVFEKEIYLIELVPSYMFILYFYYNKCKCVLPRNKIHD